MILPPMKKTIVQSRRIDKLKYILLLSGPLIKTILPFAILLAEICVNGLKISRGFLIIVFI